MMEEGRVPWLYGLRTGLNRLGNAESSTVLIPDRRIRVGDGP